MTPTEAISGSPKTLMEMGDTLRTIRSEKSVSLRDAARASGMRVPQVTQVERGERPPSNPELRGLLSSFGVTKEDFVLRLSDDGKMLAEGILLSPAGTESDSPGSGGAPRPAARATDASAQPQAHAARPAWGKSMKGEPTYFQLRSCVPCIFKRAQEHTVKQPKKATEATGATAKKGKSSDNEIVFEWTSPSDLQVQVHSAIDRYTGTVRTRYGFISDKPHVIRIRVRDMAAGQYIRPWAARVTLDGDWPRQLMAEVGSALALAGDRPKCPKCSGRSLAVESKGSTSWRCARCKYALPLRRPHSLDHFPIRARRVRRASPDAKDAQQPAAISVAEAVAEGRSSLGESQGASVAA